MCTLYIARFFLLVAFCLLNLIFMRNNNNFCAIGFCDKTKHTTPHIKSKLTLAKVNLWILFTEYHKLFHLVFNGLFVEIKVAGIFNKIRTKVAHFSGVFTRWQEKKRRCFFVTSTITCVWCGWKYNAAKTFSASTYENFD